MYTLNSFFQALATPFLLGKSLRNQRQKRVELRRFQNRSLQALIKHIYNHVPYYRRLFKNHRIKPEDIKTVNDLSIIPLSYKEDIVCQPLRNTIADNIDIKRCVNWRTAGTTGTPFSVYWSPQARWMDYVNIIRWQLECGTSCTDRRLSIGLEYLINPILFYLKIARALSTLESLEAQIQHLVTYKPRVLLGYPSALWALAKEICEKGIRGVRVETIYTSGELLNRDTRRLFEEVFGAETYDGYGTIEVGGICTECVEHSGYHIWADSVLIEFVREDQTLSPGEEGQIVVTNLTNYAMPFIRYNLRDLGRFLPDEYSCKNNFPLMQITGGREAEVSEIPGGKRIPSWELVSYMLFVQGVRQFQLVQKRINHFEIILVKGPTFNEETIEEVKAKLLSRLRYRLSAQEIESIIVEITVVDHIPRERSGKFKYFKKAY